MKRLSFLPLLAVLILVSSCSSQQFGAVATGSSLGGMFGSSIGGLFGGPRGHDAGALVGMVAGGAIGAAATSPKTTTPARSRSQRYDDATYDDVQYGRYAPMNPAYGNAHNWSALHISNIRFNDVTGDRRLNAGERAQIVMDVYNNGSVTLYDIAPQITCSNKRVAISSTALVSVLEPGQGFRYTAQVVGQQNLKTGTATFNISFGGGKNPVIAKSFTIPTQR